MFYDKETLILEEVTSTLLSNEIRKRPNQEGQEGSGLMVTGKKERGEEREVGLIKGMLLLSQRKSLEE